MHSICRDPPKYAYPPVIDIHQWQREIIERLESWLSDIPRATGMESIAKFCEVRYYELMILVLRPSPGIPEPSEETLARCFKHAVDLLRCTGELYQQETLLYSRLIVHSVFLSTLIMLHCIWRLPSIASQVQIDDLVADTGISMNVLSSIGEYWAEAKRARDCIHEISGATIQRLLRERGMETSGRNNLRFLNINPSTEQTSSTLDFAPMTHSLDNYDPTIDTSGWLNDALPGGFMDMAGVPDFDSYMWEVFTTA